MAYAEDFHAHTLGVVDRRLQVTERIIPVVDEILAAHEEKVLARQVMEMSEKDYDEYLELTEAIPAMLPLKTHERVTALNEGVDFTEKQAVGQIRTYALFGRIQIDLVSLESIRLDKKNVINNKLTVGAGDGTLYIQKTAYSLQHPGQYKEKVTPDDLESVHQMVMNLPAVVAQYDELLRLDDAQLTKHLLDQSRM